MAEHDQDLVSPPTPEEALRRRSFLQMVSASFAALGLAPACARAPDEKIIPFTQQPEELTPGVANWYASTCGGCPAGCGVLVKNRDGRPIKLEGNPDHPLSRGALCARGQATVLDLYDSERLAGPRLDGQETDWQKMDAEIRAALAGAGERGGQVRILTSTVTSPSLLRAIGTFRERHPGTKHVVYDSLSCSAILDAHEKTHGVRRLPGYRFDRAKVILGLDADFLGTWLSPCEFTKAWRVNRAPGGEREFMSWHVQLEPLMTVTGASADLRLPLRPSRLLPTVLALAKRVAKRVKWPDARRLPDAAPPAELDAEQLDRIAAELARNRGRTLVVSGANDLSVQLAVNAINAMLDNYGNTLDLAQPSLQRQGSDAAFTSLLGEMERGDVSLLVVHDANPAQDHPRADAFRRALGKVPVIVSLAGREDETAALATHVCPDHHPLESWGDAQPNVGVYSLFQPAIAPLRNTRAAVESLLLWAGVKSSAHDWIRSIWQEKFFAAPKAETSFDAFFDSCVRDGVYLSAAPLPVPPFAGRALARIAPRRAPPEAEYELVAYAGMALGDGRQANNPWLQELPDPITKVTWGNYASLSAGSARALGVKEGRVVELAGAGQRVSLPVQVQPGMPDGVVAVALGYGRKRAGPIAANYPIEKMFPVDKELVGGADVYPLRAAASVVVRPTKRMYALAKTQRYDYQVVPFTDRDRRIVRDTTLEAYTRNPRAGNEEEEAAADETLWPTRAYPGHKWVMAIDLNACTGCSACVIACQAENNVPVVGKAEVKKQRDMAWIRIDRYYSGSEADPTPHPEVGFQPMLCQHCDNAPCETVCPALATLHSSEGLNMQIYNRCVGTRYCANNCPYKVRRFNWFDYARDDLVQNLVLNPDVTVRTRGIMEKCSFCVQRIAAGKQRARNEGRQPVDGEILPACAQSCPADAIVFGDLHDPASRVAALSKDERSYVVLGDLGVRPAVRYLTRVRNRNRKV